MEHDDLLELGQRAVQCEEQDDRRRDQRDAAHYRRRAAPEQHCGDGETKEPTHQPPPRDPVGTRVTERHEEGAQPGA
jgi:hypothetical protein